ncbi:MAG TPA: hypothetical protein DEB24_07720 [Coriobacteriia bacterium]|nr:hypothetical protein [Coriobacteriia bacterium]
MKKAIAIVLAGILAASMLAFLGGCRGAADNIENVTMDPTESGLVTIKNYKVHLKSDVDWTGLNDSQREEIARAGFNKAQEQIKAESVFNYSITGYSSDGALAFSYDRQNQQMIIAINGEMATTFPLEVPASE